MAKIGLAGYLVALGIGTASCSIGLTSYLLHSSPNRPERPSIVERVQRTNSQVNQYQSARDTASSPSLQAKLDSAITKLKNEKDSLSTPDYLAALKQYQEDSARYETQKSQAGSLVYGDEALLTVVAISLIGGLTAAFRSRD
ncbi:hypothetical protein HY212_02130 [Candidatus Pacearchaeota archaeon]|nr:hypothetical protein [Candidatus Pacearchaeota archaeon]